MVVSPPALLPGEGLALISAPCLWVYSSHQCISATSFSPDLPADRAAGEQMLGAIRLRGLRQDDRATMADDQVARDPERRIGRDAGIAVRPPALQGDLQVLRRDGLTTDLIRLLEHLPHEGEPCFDRLAGATHALDVHVADPVGQLVLPQHLADLVHLAPEPEHDHVREVGVPRVAGQRAAQQLQPLAGRHAAAGLVRERHHAIDVGELGQRVLARERIALERIGDQAGHMGAAVHGRQDADVVARRDAPVRADDPLERRRFRNVRGRFDVDPVGVVLVEVAHAQVVDMDVLTWSNGLDREADDLIVFSDRLAWLDRTHGHLVPGRDALSRDHLIRDGGPGEQRATGNHHAISRMQLDDRVRRGGRPLCLRCRVVHRPSPCMEICNRPLPCRHEYRAGRVRPYRQGARRRV